MAAESKTASPFPPYDQRSQRTGRRAWDFFTRDLTAKDLVTAFLAIVAIIAALGWTINSPGKRLDALDARVIRTERRIDTLAEAQRFTNYMLCVNARRLDPASAPPDCAPLIEARTAK